MAKILVTGIAGFIGSWTGATLAERGDQVIGLDNFNDYYDPKLKRDRVKRLLGDCKVIRADITDLKALRKIFKAHKIEKVCHLAAQAGVRYSLTNPFTYEKTNFLGTLNLLEACREQGVKTFVYASSSSVYGNNKKIPFAVEDPVDQPISLYAVTKKSNELMAYTYHHLYGLKVTGLRFFTVYGPWGRPDMAYFKFADAITKGKTIDVYNFGKMKRDFTYVSDIVAGVTSALDKSHACEIFNLGNSRAVELLYMIQCLEKELGKKAKTKLLPIQPGDLPESFADIQKSAKLLGFKPQVKIEEGLHQFVEWFKRYFN